MTVTTTAHANFRGQARAALTFYHSVFGGALPPATYAGVTWIVGVEAAQG